MLRIAAALSRSRVGRTAGVPLLRHAAASAARSAAAAIGGLHAALQPTTTARAHRHAHTTAAAAGHTGAQSAPAASSPSLGSSRVGDAASCGFRIAAIDGVEEFNMTVYRLTHAASGALAYHIARPDTDNAFSVAFRTPVDSSNGVAHILEHTALCGSQRYPVRDPFFMLVRRSLKTFMNAMTAQDYTMYPFSTQNAKDYANLLEVYLDAAFFPLLNRMDFKQEGHRLELAAKARNANDAPAAAASTGGLQIKGVVFNEMKGAMSDTSQLFMARLQEELFPTNSNHWNSGGEPAVIPTLTHEQLKAFHRRSYNIDNAVFISYGDREPPLQLIHDRVIQPVLAHRAAHPDAAREVPPAYRPETRLPTPKVVETTCPPDPLIPDPSKQVKVSMAWLCPSFEGMPDEEREVEQFALQMLSSLLLDSATAPMYQALIDPNFGSGYAPGTGFDSSTVEPAFAIGLQNVSDADVPTILSRIESTLIEVSKDGFPTERIEASIHQIEIGLKHVRSNFGIGLLMRMIPAWANRTSPILPLRVNTLIASLRAKLAAGPYFQSLVTKHLLTNSHRVTLIMRPDAEYAQKEAAIEAAKLSAQAATLTAAEKEEIASEAQLLIRLQESKQDTKGCQLPSLSVEDISPAAERIELRSLSVPTAVRPAASSASLLPRFVSLSQPTNGVGYLRALVSAKVLPLDLRPYLPLYTSLLTEVGAGSMDYRQLSHALDMSTGGVSAEVQVFAHLDNLQQHEEFVLFKSLALERNIPRMFELVREVLYSARFDNLDRLQQLLLQTAASGASSLQDSGSSYATSDASQHLFSSAAASEIYSGIKYIQHMHGIVESMTRAASPEEARRVLEEVASKLQRISEILLAGGLDRAFIVGDDSSLQQLERHLPSLLTSTTDVTRQPVEFHFTRAVKAQQTFYALPLQVNNVSLVLPTVPYTHADAPTLDVMAKILSSVYVHREVREKGGAYGGHVSHSSDGMLAFSSYRDPNTSRTLDAYRASAKWLAAGDNFSPTDIEEALLSIFSGIDAPKPPSSKGLGQFLFGITHDQRQQYRDRLLGVSKASVLDVCARYLSPGRFESAHVTIVGNAAAVPSEIASSRAWRVQAVELNDDMATEDEEHEDEAEEEQRTWA